MKTSALTLFLSLAVLTKLFSQNVGINSTGSTPDASAMLDVSSTTKGFLMPRMTTTERNAIASPATGLTIFNTTIVAYQVNTGTPASPVWSTLGTGSGSVSSVSVTTANGVSGIVATPSTTPAITLSLGAITPSSVAATGTMTGSNLSGTNTGDITIGTANGLSLAGQALSLGLASTSTTGALSSTDWNTFNNKASAANTWALGGNGVASAQNIGTTSNYDLPFITNNTEKMRLTSGGNLGLGLSVPTAVLHLKAGTATANTAPLKFTSGTLLTTAEAGAEEFLTDKFYGTITTGAARKEFTLNDVALTSGRVPFATTNGRLTDLAAFTYVTNRLSPTYITLGAGAAAAGSAPLIFTSGVSLTTPVAGAMEFTTDNPTFTITTGAARKQFTLNDAALTSGRVPYTTTNGRLIDNASMTYSASRLSPTYVTLAAGTAAAGTAPLVFTSGTNLTTPVAGSVEFNGTHFYGTVGATRYQLDQQAGTTYTGSNGITLSATDFRNNLITGIAGGQTIIGGTASNNSLTLTSTSHVTKGKILFGTSAYDEQNNRLGIGNTSPTEAVDITGNLKFSGALMPNNLSGTSGQFLTSGGAGTAPLWATFDTSNIANFYQKVQSLFGATAPVTYSNGLIGITQATTSTNGYLSSTDWNKFNNKSDTTNSWAFGGNSVASIQSIGTKTNFELPFITNNVEKMRISKEGNLGIGAAVVDGSNAERLLVDGGTTSYNVISGKGDLNNYLQLNIKNKNAGTAASSDVVATNDAGDEENGINYVDMGVNSSGNTSTGVLGGANTTYLYSTGADFSIGNAIAGNNLILFTGGTAASNERMRINGNGNVGIGITNPTQKLDLTGNFKLTGAFMPGNSAGTSGQFLTSTGVGTSPAWATLDTTNITSFYQKVQSLFSSTAPITYSNGVIGVTQSNTSTDGYLSSTDWNTFNNKASAANTWALGGNGVASAQNLGTTSNFDLPFITNNTEKIRLTTAGKLGIGLSVPTAVLHLKAGTAAANTAPLKFTSGTLLTTAEAGAEEFLTDKFYGTITTGAARKEFTLNDAALTSGRVPYTTTNGRLIDNASMTYSASRLSPTYLTLAAGTAAAGTAPLVFTSGTNLTTPLSGAVEFNGTHFYGTVAGVRYQLDQQTGTTYTGSNGITLSATDFRNNLITGIAGGQTIIGGTASNNSLTLTSTSHVTKGKILFGTSAYDEQNNRLGIGNTSPTEAVDVTGNLKFSGALMPNNLSGTSGQFLTSGGAGTAALWTTFDTTNIANFYQKVQSLFGATAPVTYSNGLISITQATTSTNGYLSSTDWNKFNNKSDTTNTWAFGGNSVASVQSIGTKTNFDFPFITNNTEAMRISAGGNVGIGTAVVDGSNAERLLVDGGTTSYNVISGKGDLNNYLQLNIKNRNAGTAASSDVVATNDAGTEENGINYVDMGVNSSGNTSTGVLGGANTTYLYSTGADFSIGNAIAGNNLILFTGGTASSNERMRINGNGNVGIGTTTPTAVLHLKAGTATASTSPLKFTSGTLLTTAEAGAEEFLTDKFYGTITTGAARKEFTLNDAALTSGRVPYTTTNGRLIDNASMTYAASRLSPTYLTLAAGTAAVGTAPLVFTSGTNLTTPIAGAVEFNGTHFYGTVGATRYQLDQQTTSSWAYGGNNVASAQNIGTTSNYDLPFVTNNTEKMRLTSSGNLGVATTSPNSTLDVTQGSVSLAITTQTGNYTATSSDHTILMNNTTPKSVTLPTAAGITGRVYVIKKISATGTSTVKTAGSETIDGASTKSLTQYDFIMVQSDGANWVIISN